MREKEREHREKRGKKSRKFLEPGLSVQPYFRSNSDHDSSHLGILLISALSEVNRENFVQKPCGKNHWKSIVFSLKLIAVGILELLQQS